MKNILLLVFLIPSMSYAREIPLAYLEIANKKNVPADILYSIALTESGYKVDGVYNPWPWTLNIEGDSYRFSNKNDALRFLKKAIKNSRSVDAGIMQINWKWHKGRFKDIHLMLDPYFNVEVGAEILLEQYVITGDWWVAVGRYHRPAMDYKSLKRAENYRKRVRKHWKNIT